MSGEVKILLWWVLFGGAHVLGSSVPVRTRVIGAIGLQGFKGVYTLVAFATFVPLVYVYWHAKHEGAQMFEPGGGLKLVAQALMLAAFVVLVQGLTTPNPLTTSAEMSGKFPNAARGIQRVTRHPSNFGFCLFGVAHCLSNPFVSDWLFFGGFLIYAVVSAIHQDKRTLATGPEAVAQFQQDTSLVPFGAILGGRQQLALAEYKIGPLVASVVVFVFLRVMHGKFFGGFAG